MSHLKMYSGFTVSSPGFKKIALAVVFFYSLCFSLLAQAALTFSAPATDADGTYTLSWTGMGVYVALHEQVGGTSTWTNIAGGSITSKVITGKTPATYHYRLDNYCQNPPYSPILCESVTKSVVVGLASPTISGLSNTTINEDSSAYSIAFTVDDLDTPANSLTVTASSSNTALIPASSLVVGGSGSSRTISVTPVANASGSSTITITVSDGGRATTASVVVTVTPVNDSPTISTIANRTINEDTSTGAVAFSVNDIESGGAVTVTASSSNTSLVPVGNIVLGGSGTSRTVNVTPVANLSGSATITLVVSDGSLTASSAFVLTVSAVNDAPTIANIADRAINEDAGTGSIAFTVADIDTAATSLVISATSSNIALIPVSNIALGGSGNSRTLTATPLANAYGSTTISVTVSDGQLTSSDTFVVTVNAVNDAPVISHIANLSTNQETSTGPISFTVSDVDISSPANLVVSAVVQAGTLNSSAIVLGGAGATRTITVTPPQPYYGQSTISLSVSDSVLSTSTSFILTVVDTAPQLFVDSNSGAGAFTLSWKYANDSIKLFESRNGATAVDVFGGEYAPSSSKAFSKSLDGTYTYKLYNCTHSQLGADCSTLSDTEIIAVVLPIPDVPVLTLSALTSGTGEYTVSWTSVARSNSFELQENNLAVSNGGNALFVNKQFLGSSAKPTGLYDYKVRACNAAGCSAYSAAQTVKVAKPAKVSAVTASMNATTGVATVNWTIATAATKYEVQQKLNAGTWGATQTVTSNSITMAAVTTAGSYGYQVRACDVAGDYTGCSAWVASNAVSMATPALPVLSVPPTNTTGSYSVSWTATANTSGYVLNENGVDRPSTTTSSYGPVTKANGSYQYKVKACNAVGCGAYTAVATVDVAKVGAMGTVTASLDQPSGVPSLSWPAVSGATRYTIQPLLNGANNGAVVNVTTNSASLPAITAAGNYSYKVFACAVVGSNTNCSSSVTSNVVTPTVPASAPVVTVPLNSSTGAFTVKWNSVSNAAKYEIYENNTKISTVSTLSLIFSSSNARATGQYTYKVRACNALCGPFSNLASINVVRSSTSSSASSATGAAVLNQPVINPLTDYATEDIYLGALAGTQSVGADGSFNYSLPIAIPAGINGVQPQLSLSYNSNRKNDLLGWGWSLGGLSAISRCSASMIRDGQVSGIQASDNYRYCFDGQRLVEVSSGEYRTESESFLRIQKISTYWLVTNARGTKTRYGFNADSHQTDDQAQPFVWYLDEQKDISGNSWSVTYTKDTAAGTHYPQQIDYTQNPLLTAQHSIIFHYENRSDTSVKMVAGTKVKTDKRLIKIEAQSAGQTVKTYALDYQQHGQTYHGKAYSDPAKTSRLAKVTLCYTSSIECAKPVEFDWNVQSTGNYRFTPSGLVLNGETVTPAPKLYLDINGDGELDPYYVDDSADSYVYTGHSGDVITIRPKYKKADVNHDGYDDVVKEFKYVTGIQFFLSNGQSINTQPANGFTVAKEQLTFTSKTTWTSFGQGGSTSTSPDAQTLTYNTQYVDLNADGLLDVVRYPLAYSYGDRVVELETSPGDISVALNTGTGFSAFTTWYANWKDVVGGGMEAPNFRLSFTDLNGDGALDFLATSNFPEASQVIIAGLNNGNGGQGGAFTVDFLGQNDALRGLMGDFNGDGLADIAKMPMKDNHTNAMAISEVINVSLGAGKIQNMGGIIKGFLPPSLALSGYPFISFCGNSRVPNTDTQEDICSRTAKDFNSDGLDDILEWGGRATRECLDNPLPTRSSPCLYVKRTYTDYKAYVYLSLGANSSGSVTFAPPVAYKDFATLQSISATVSDPTITNGPKAGLADYNNDGAFEDHSRLQNNVLSNRIEQVVEANRNLNVNYKSLTSDEIYKSVPDLDSNEAENGLVYLSKITGQRFGVKELSVSNGVGGVNKTRYTFKSSKTHGAGYGDLGFATVEKIETVAGATPLKTISHYYQTANAQYKLAGHLKQQLVYTSNANGDSVLKLSDTRYQWKVRTYADDVDAPYKSPHYFAYLYESSSETWDLDGTKVANSLTQNHPTSASSCTLLAASPAILTTAVGSSTDVDYHSDGVLLYSETATCDTSVSSAAVQIQALENVSITTRGDARGLVGKRKQYAWAGSAIALASKAAYEVRTQGFTYNDVGQVATKTIEPDIAAGNTLKLVSTFAYNGYGSVSSLTESWDDATNDGLALNSRVTSIAETYDTFGARKLVVTKPLNLIETTEFHPIWGAPTKQIDVNGLVTTTAYDSAGRAVLMTYADGTSTQVDYRHCANGFDYNASCVWYSQTKTTGSAAQRTYFDGFNRTIGSRSSGLDGRAVYSVQTYNARGSVDQSTAAFYYGEALQTVTYHYDAIGRVVKLDYPDGASETRTYAGLIHTSTNRLLQTQTRHLNAAGWVMKSLDNTSTPVVFSYWPFGDLKTTQVNNNANTLVSVVYDKLGRKTEMTDPNTGKVSYTYNALDLIATQTDAKNQRTCYLYDVLGRQVQRVDNASATCTGTATQTWAYDTKPNGKGQLASLTGKNTDGSAYSESYSYTSYGLPQTTATSFDGVSYNITRHYDAYNRPQGVTYPTGYIAANRYNDYGHLEQVLDSTGATVWTANSADAMGNLTQFTLGNGVVTDQTYKPDTGLIDTIRAAKGALVIQNQAYQFDSLGNLTRRADLKNSVTQSFCYDGLNRLKAARFDGCSSASNDYSYDPLGNLTAKVDAGSSAITLGYTGQGQSINNAGPHAVTVANGWSYQYDALGNLTQATKTGEATRAVQYSPFNTPTSITQGSQFSTLVYGPNQERIKHSDSNGRATKYIGGIYEEVTQGGITQKIHYLGDFALFVQKGGATPTNKHEYLHRDHIGSVVAITGTTLNSSTDVQWQANGAWGERRFQQWNGLRDPDFVPTSIARGFTDHEHLDSVGLIHMNGRVYDPELGRFMSADPFVQAPYNTQSYNRYSYVFNNPLSFTDPSGFATDCGSAGNAGVAPGGVSLDCNQQTSDEEEAERQNREDAMRDSYNQTLIASMSRAVTIVGPYFISNQTSENIQLISALTGETNPLDKMWQDSAKESEKLANELGVGGYKTAAVILVGLANARGKGAKKNAEALDTGASAPRNAQLAGKNHPKTGVPFDKDGFPDFSKLKIAEVKISQTGSRAGDDRAANKAAGLEETPKGYTWHHHQDGFTMQLVPRDIHAQTGHTGGYNGK